MWEKIKDCYWTVAGLVAFLMHDDDPDPYGYPLGEPPKKEEERVPPIAIFDVPTRFMRRYILVILMPFLVLAMICSIIAIILDFGWRTAWREKESFRNDVRQLIALWFWKPDYEAMPMRIITLKPENWENLFEGYDNLSPQLKQVVRSETSLHDRLRIAGCKCDTPILGYHYGDVAVESGPCCKICNTVIADEDYPDHPVPLF
jgi:hypothetical protein